jgi:hypothetical protein
MADLIKTFALEDFAYAFGTDVDSISSACRSLIASKDFRYRIPAREERDQIILGILQRIEADRQVIGAEERKGVWDKGWKENLDSFVSSGYNLKELVPKFIRNGQAVRLNQNFAIPLSPAFELDFVEVFVQWLFESYLQGCSHIYEFGCGSSFNLATFAQLSPTKRFTGLDFVPSSVELANLVGSVYHWDLSGRFFDMISPDSSLYLESGCGVFTSGTVEQLAGKFESFLQYLLSQPLKMCVHIEPTFELYDESSFVDYLALKFLSKRGYTQGYLTRLRELAVIDEIELVKVKRLYFGSLYQEGYMYMVWRPKL